MAAAVAELGLHATLLFFDASDEVLLRRYSDTRRRHPLAHFGLSLPEAISREREITAPLRSEADVVIDTTALNVHQLRRRIIAEFALNNGCLAVAAVRVLRLQARGAGRRGFRVRRAGPAQPALESAPAAAVRPRRRACATTWTRNRKSANTSARSCLPRHLAAAPARGDPQLRHHRLRLHRRQAPLGLPGRTPGRARARARLGRSGDFPSGTGLSALDPGVGHAETDRHPARTSARDSRFRLSRPSANVPAWPVASSS